MFSRLEPASLKTIFGIDLRTLALFRILLGVYILVDLVCRSRDLTAHYSDTGVLPRTVQIDQLSTTTWSFHLANGSLFFQAFLFVLAGLFACALILGWRTRLMTVLSWAFMLSLQNRNTYVLSGEDSLAVLMLFWSMFLPLGARYSIDEALDRTDRFKENSYLSLATAALLLQGMSMYFFSALLKTHPIWYLDGTAVYYALNLDYFATAFSIWFRQFDSLMQGLTYYVYGLELIGPFLIFSPYLHRTLRTVFMLAFMTMHLAFLLFLEIGFFPFISIIMNLTFMPGWMWDKLAKRLPQRSAHSVSIWFDRGCDFCEKTCCILKTFLFLSHVPVRAAQEQVDIGLEVERRNSWVLTRGDKKLFKSEAFGELLSASPVFFPAALLFKPHWALSVSDRLYDWVGRNRKHFSKVTRRYFPWRDTGPRYGMATQFLAGGFLVFVSIQNVSTLPWSGMSLPTSFKMVRQALGLYQNWTMFAPYPEMISPWPVIEGELTDGTLVDVYKSRLGPASFDRPEVVSREYANYRWRKYLSILEDTSYEDTPQTLMLHYGRFLCRTWSRQHPGSLPLAQFVIYFQIERTPPPGRATTEVRIRQVWTHDCLA